VAGSVGCTPALYRQPGKRQRVALETIEIEASLPNAGEDRLAAGDS
jgi:hypothetical protein